MLEKMLKLGTVMVNVYLAILHPSHVIFGVLIVVFIVDYVSKILSEISLGNAILPDVAMKGLVKKLNRLLYVIVALSVDILISYNLTLGEGVNPVSTAVITWMIINELLSICRNISNNELIDVPPMLQKFFDKFKEIKKDE